MRSISHCPPRRETWRPLAALLLVAALLGSLTLWTGCNHREAGPPANDATRAGKAAGRPAPRETAGPPLKLLVVGDERMTEAISRLEAEFAAQTGVKFIAIGLPPADFAHMPAPEADALIVPSSFVGDLIERGWAESIPADELDRAGLAWSDVFEALAVREATWNGQAFAIPFGSPPLVCWYRADLFETFRRRPPTTWAEYQESAAFFADRANLADSAPPVEAAWSGALEPWAPGWAGRLLLARAACYALDRDAYSTFFNIDTMKPLVDSPPFVRALDELVAARQLPGANSAASDGRCTPDPADVRRAFLAGEAAMALTWPSGAKSGPSDAKRGPSDAKSDEAKPAADGVSASNAEFAIGFVTLPGSDMVYSQSGKRWNRRGPDEPRHATLLGLAGRWGLVMTASPRPADARRLLAWLSTTWAPRTCAVSEATTMFRRSQLRKPEPWVDPDIERSAAKQYAQMLDGALSQPAAAVAAPRIPGQDEYLAALDDAVAAVFVGERKSGAALVRAAETWNTITDRLGRERQRAAYRRGLGLQP